MSSPIQDDGRRLMMKCSGNYISSAANKSCEDPSVLESITCPVNRAGDSLYTCFNMAGDQSTFCRNTCLHGYPQDYQRTLYNQDTGGAYPLYWEERGVELYENFGLSEVTRGGAGSYTFGYGTDRNSSDSAYGSYCSASGDNGGKWPNCRNSCITELGRKITLFGQIGFTTFEDWGEYSQYNNKNVTGGFRLPDAYNYSYMQQHGNYYYLVNFYKTAANQTADYIDQYEYFGNSGIVFKDANGNQFYFIYGMDPFIMNNGAKSVPSQAALDQLLYDPTNRSLLINIKYFDENASVVGLICRAIPQATIIKPGNCSRSPNMDGIDQPAIPYPFPGNLNAQIYCDMSHSAYSYSLSTTPNCYYSGTRSMYIPPHMKVTGFTHMEYQDQNKTWSSDYGSVEYSLVSKTGFRPFTYQDSPFHNGVFPSLGGSTANSPYDTYTGEQYSPSSQPKGGAYTNPTIFNCSLAGIWVDVRRDAQFRAIYVPDKFYNENYLFPEIFLVPGVEKASRFQTDTTATIKKMDDMQYITDPAKLWSDSNPYWQLSQVVELDPTKSPYDALPVPSGATTQSLIASIPLKLGKQFRDIPVIGTVIDRVSAGLAMPIRLRSRFDQLGVVNFSDKPYTGTGRIRSFVPINGIMSIEWTYVVYRCAFSYQPGQTNRITYDSESKLYTFGDNTNACGAECMLYRDPYYASNLSSQNVSASDMMMKTVCGMKTYTMAYAQFSNATANDCACVSAAGFCPSLYNSNCMASYSGQDQHYTSDQTTDQQCPGTCGYCSTTVVQINMANQNGNLDDPVNSANLGNQCTASTCTYSDGQPMSQDPTNQTDPPVPDQPPSGGDSGGDDGQKDDTKDKKINWNEIIPIILLIIVLIVVLLVCAGAGYWYFTSPKNAK